MNPIDVPPGDRRMYYNGVFMLHNSMGYVKIQSDGGECRAKTEVGETYRKVNLSDLFLCWPEGGAYNINGGAYYIGRQARRSTKKSASPEHYTLLWGTGFRAITDRIMFGMLKATPYKTFPEALKALTTGRAMSVAISRDIIIAWPAGRTGNKFDVVFRGVAVGSVNAGTPRKFTPTNPGAPVNERVIAKLRKENVI